MAAPVHVADDNATTAGRPPGGAIDGQIDRAAGATKARAMPYRRGDSRRVGAGVEHESDRADQLTGNGHQDDIASVETIGHDTRHEHQHRCGEELDEADPTNVNFATGDVVDLFAQDRCLQHETGVETRPVHQHRSHVGRAQDLSRGQLSRWLGRAQLAWIRGHSGRR